MYASLNSSVLVSGGLTPSFPSLVGLKQGCNLSPLLFNLFIDDFVGNLAAEDSVLLGDTSINCLLYADDIVLISESSNGLQNLINKLHEFSKTWFLEVNTTKTKSLIFSRKRSKPTSSFDFGDTKLPACDSYCYLGTTFSQNGSFKQATNVLRTKALNSMFSLLRSLYKYRSCSTEIMLKLFDSLTLPIALYNSEVWGPQCFNSNPRNTMLLMDKSGKLSVNLQYKFLKIILGVGKKSSNWAVLSEVGRSPLCAKVMVNMAKYWFHLVNTPSPILREAFFGNVSLSLQGIKSWFTMVKRILVFLGIDHILYTTDLNEIAFQIGRLKNIVQSKYRDIWKAELNEHILKGGKLSFFTQFKKEFGLSGYLNKGLAPELRIALTRLRISAHKLPIETGRYRGLERAQRTCPYCCIAIGDEQHYLVNCQNVIIFFGKW
jgi:hypothetical protein